MMTDETMQALALDYDEEASRIMTGDADRERYVSEADYLRECDPRNGTTHTFEDKNTHRTFLVWECWDCGEITEVGK